jgi:small subunit ribosomal protein S6
MNLYETGFLIAPNLSDEETETLIQQMAEVVSQKNGKLIKTEKWGKRRLAYRIGKFQEAHYVFFHYEGQAEIPLELARRMRQTETVLRYLTLKKDETANVRSKRKARHQAKREEARAAEAAENAPPAGQETKPAGENHE